MAHRSGGQLIHTVLVVNQDQIGWQNLSLAFFLQESGYNARPLASRARISFCWTVIE